MIRALGALRTTANVVAVAATGLDLVVINRIAILTLIELLAHHMIEITAAEEKYLAERLAEVLVEDRVDDRVQQAVAIAEPEKETREKGRNGVRVLEERSDQRQHEEWQPATDERAHDDAQGGAGFPLLRQMKAQLLLVRRVGDATRAVQVIAHERRRRRHLLRRRRRHRRRCCRR